MTTYNKEAELAVRTAMVTMGKAARESIKDVAGHMEKVAAVMNQLIKKEIQGDAVLAVQPVHKFKR